MSAGERIKEIAKPFVPLNVQNMVLAALLTLLKEVGEYNLQKQAINRKRKRARHDKERKEKARAKKRRKDKEEGADPMPMSEDPPTDSVKETPNIATENDDAVIDDEVLLPSEPPVLSHLTCGINEVTKRLEKQAKSRRFREVVSTTDPPLDNPTEATGKHLSYIFVCRSDIDPPILIAHLPELVASCNVPIPSRPLIPVYLISLPKRAEYSLAESLALRRVSILAFDTDTPQLDTVTKLLEAVQPPSASWLVSRVSRPSNPPAQLLPTHIKQLRTTAPRDMRKSKEDRKKRQDAAKETRTAKKGKNAKVRPGVTKMNRKLKIVSVPKDLLPT
ncbi:hypothetical protein Clacol_010042 [Clathrus columnatus]|uniref:Uncharacterized protein n=1 Tax=Clathrus columnatus TaxID=1419009 RepID=A0AAV5AMD6_9AGAM|nr:hypothetical protein Clacol_010042 [Clathrus columnatus]